MDRENEGLTWKERRRKRREHGSWPARFLKALKTSLHSRVTPLQRMYDTSELTPRRRRQLRVLEMYFSPALVARLRPILYCWSEYMGSLSKLVRERCRGDGLIAPQVWKGPTYLPGSSAIDRLLEAVDLVFHPDISSQIASNVRGFDQIAGVECSETFVAQTTVRLWMRYLIDYVLLGVATTGVRFLEYDAFVINETESDGNLGENPFGRRTSAHLRALDEQTVAVEQITLKGSTILEAWTKHPTTRRFSRMPQGEEQLPNNPANLGPTWTPAQGGAQFVYAATNSHYTMLSWFQLLHRGIPVDFDQNQITRPKRDAPLTTFSPLRSYLWAAFKAHMPCLKPPVSEMRHLQKPWRHHGGGIHRGVVMNQYRAMEPSTADYTIPNGRETEWGALALDGSFGYWKDLWAYFVGIHGQGGRDEWPSAIYGSAYPAPQSSTFKCHANLWRTAWVHAWLDDHVLTNYSATFAISFQRSM